MELIVQAWIENCCQAEQDTTFNCVKDWSMLCDFAMHSLFRHTSATAMCWSWAWNIAITYFRSKTWQLSRALILYSSTFLCVISAFTQPGADWSIAWQRGCYQSYRPLPFPGKWCPDSIFGSDFLIMGCRRCHGGIMSLRELGLPSLRF